MHEMTKDLRAALRPPATNITRTRLSQPTIQRPEYWRTCAPAVIPSFVLRGKPGHHLQTGTMVPRATSTRHPNNNVFGSPIFWLFLRACGVNRSKTPVDYVSSSLTFCVLMSMLRRPCSVSDYHAVPILGQGAILDAFHHLLRFAMELMTVGSLDDIVSGEYVSSLGWYQALPGMLASPPFS